MQAVSMLERLAIDKITLRLWFQVHVKMITICQDLVVIIIVVLHVCDINMVVDVICVCIARNNLVMQRSV